jgi:NADH-quinone oxidoreductase subunit A
MGADFTPILILVGFAALICAAMVTLSWVLGPKKATPYKASAYECGVAPSGDARERFPIKFYLVAILFVLFDIEVVFLWSWLTVFKDAPLEFQLFSFWAVMIYMGLWILGDAYVLRVRAIDWDESDTIEESRVAEAEEESATPVGRLALQPAGGGE